MLKNTLLLTVIVLLLALLFSYVFICGILMLKESFSLIVNNKYEKVSGEIIGLSKMNNKFLSRDMAMVQIDDNLLQEVILIDPAPKNKIISFNYSREFSRKPIYWLELNPFIFLALSIFMILSPGIIVFLFILFYRRVKS